MHQSVKNKKKKASWLRTIGENQLKAIEIKNI
jgi:hypothetical protein